MKIYNYDSLNEHIKYGDYSDTAALVIPPHPKCLFCSSSFYNDESLFKHMNENHFGCQLCRDKKNIIFYREISNLLDHYKSWHYVCPYQECLENIYVVFESEEKLNSHLITKHKCTDAKNKIASFIFGDSDEQYGNKKQKQYNDNKESFNFSQYVNDLKDTVRNYQLSLVENAKRYTSKNSKYDDNYNYNDKYYNKKKKKQGDYYDAVIEHDNRSNKYSQKRDYKAAHHSHSLENNITEVKIDYSFVFNTVLKMIKNYVSDKIRAEIFKEEEFILPQETTYQLIIVIDKIDANKLYELSNLGNFGVDIENVKQLKSFMIQGDFLENKLNPILDRLLTKRLLVVYKYIDISTKKIDSLFYKLEYDQIDQDLYEDFAIRKKKKIKTLNEKQPLSKNIRVNDDHFPAIAKNKSSINARWDSKNSHNLKTIIGMNSNEQKRDISQPVMNEKENKNKIITTNTIIKENVPLKKSQNKLVQLLETKDPPKQIIPKPDVFNKGLNRTKIDYDEEFPEL